MTKAHLHSEQFDGWWHPVCGRVPDRPAVAQGIVCEDAFERTPKKERCRYCAAEMWPKGGEPQ